MTIDPAAARRLDGFLETPPEMVHEGASREGGSDAQGTASSDNLLDWFDDYMPSIRLT